MTSAPTPDAQQLRPFSLHDVDVVPSGENAPYWEGTEQGEVRVQACTACEARRFPARVGCPACGHLEADWVAVRGTPQLYSWVVVERAPLASIEVPYAVCIADYPQDGVRIYGSLVGDPNQFRAGQDLTMRTGPSAGVNIPVYEPR